MPATPHQKIAPLMYLDPRFHDRLIWCSEWETFLINQPDGTWRTISDDELATQVMRVIASTEGLSEISLTNSKLLDIVGFMKREDSLSVRVPKERYLVFSDRLYDMELSLPLPAGAPMPDPIADGLAFVGFPFPYPDPSRKIPTPVFDRFLSTSLVYRDAQSQADPSLVKIVQEMMGHVLLPSMEAAAAFFLYGAGKNGKSKLADLTRSLVGDRLSSAMTLESLTANRFSASFLVGKKLNVCNEDESQYLASDKFKAVVSGEYITAERKYGATFNFSPTAKYLFCTNSPPRFDGLNYGLKRRVKIIPFYRQITEEEKDVHLAAKLQAELPGIVQFALEGARRLQENKYVFSDAESKAVQEETEEFENTVSNGVRFVRENYRIDDEGFTSNTGIYAHYVEWCKENGCKPMSSMNFHKDTTRNLDLKSIVRNIGGISTRCKNLSPKNEDPLL